MKFAVSSQPAAKATQNVLSLVLHIRLELLTCNDGLLLRHFSVGKGFSIQFSGLLNCSTDPRAILGSRTNLSYVFLGNCRIWQVPENLENVHRSFVRAHFRMTNVRRLRNSRDTGDSRRWTMGSPSRTLTPVPEGHHRTRLLCALVWIIFVTFSQFCLCSQQNESNRHGPITTNPRLSFNRVNNARDVAGHAAAERLRRSRRGF
jgi:hypothetical protein